MSVAALLLVGGSGCSQNTENPARTTHAPQSVTAQMVARRESPPPDKAPAAPNPVAQTPTQPARPVKALAMVNDSPIDQAQFLRTLLDARGLPVLQQVLLREVAQQEAKRRNIEISQADIDREFDVALRGERFNGKDVEALTPSRREQLIDDWTRTRGVSRAELAIAMERQAILRKISEQDLRGRTIDDEQLQREFRRRHGEKVEIRHIQFDAQRVADQIAQRLALGDRFEDLVADYSQNTLTKMRQGLMPAFAEEDETVPPILAQAAFALNPGEVSNPIEVDNYLHVLKLERRIPPEEVSIDDVKETLEHGLRARMIEEHIEQLGRRLLMAAALRIKDPSLRSQYKKQQRTGQIEGPPLVGQ